MQVKTKIPFCDIRTNHTYPVGSVINLIDNRALNMIAQGYAEAIEPEKPEEPAKPVRRKKASTDKTA